MNKFRTGCMLLSMAITVCFISCGGGNDKTTESTDSKMADTSTVVTPAATAPVNTINTTPQHMVVIRHKVTDFDKWMAAYESHDSARMANGLHNYVIGRAADDQNMVLVALKADDMAKAKAFAKDPGLKTAMKNGGVVGTPMIEFETTYYQDTAPVESQMRSVLHIIVKDRDAWQKSFDDGKQGMCLYNRFTKYTTR